MLDVRDSWTNKTIIGSKSKISFLLKQKDCVYVNQTLYS